jgi:dihydroorotate dehydrogenase
MKAGMVLADLMMPLARRIDPERAHRLAIKALKLGLAPRCVGECDPALQSTVFGIEFTNPVGLAAGFDKSAEAPEALLRMGCGFVEVGTLTPRPQSGNPKPRVFRLAEDQGVINRYGFNNDGLEVGLDRMMSRDRDAGIVGINVGINKDSTNQAGDFADAIRRSSSLADYLTVNISSPNTPGLRDLQAGDQLDGLLDAVINARDTATGKGAPPPVLLKIAPDLTRDMIEEIVEIAVARGVAALIVANTTVTRPEGLKSSTQVEAGGLSGPPLFQLSTQVLAWAYIATAGRIPIIGAGGVVGPETAYAKIRAGASLVQLYTALIYKGPGLFRAITVGLGAQLRNDGFVNIADAVGIDAARWADGTAI